MSRLSRTSEKITMIDVAAAAEEFRDKQILSIGFFGSTKYIADGLKSDENILNTERFECKTTVFGMYETYDKRDYFILNKL